MSNFTKQKGPSESRYWHFRINDLSDEQYIKLKENADIEWIVIGEIEKENEKGTHYHVAVKFERSVRRNFALNKLLFNHSLAKDNDYYLESKYTKCSIEQFISYTIKNGIRYDTYHLEDNDAEEDAIAKEIEKPKLSPLELNKLRLQKAREGDEDWFLENDFNFMLGNKYAKLVALSQPSKTHEDIIQGELDNYWIWGATGTCKSASVHLVWPNAYSKVVSNSKWDNYQTTNPDHQVVHVEEVDDFEDIKEGLEGLAGLKRMADRYPFAVRFNYGSRNLMIRPKTFVITSNFSIEQIIRSPDRHGNFCRGAQTQIDALNRKFKVLHISEFKKLFNIRNKYDYNGKLVGCEFIDAGITPSGATTSALPESEEEELPSTSEFLPITTINDIKKKNKKTKRVSV